MGPLAIYNILKGFPDGLCANGKKPDREANSKTTHQNAGINHHRFLIPPETINAKRTPIPKVQIWIKLFTAAMSSVPWTSVIS